MKADAAADVIALLQDRLNALNDLALTLKHVHGNVVGPNFFAVHTSSTLRSTPRG
jgi:starvation-inducible DNA-binding protein